MKKLVLALGAVLLATGCGGLPIVPAPVLSTRGREGVEPVDLYRTPAVEVGTSFVTEFRSLRHDGSEYRAVIRDTVVAIDGKAITLLHGELDSMRTLHLSQSVREAGSRPCDKDAVALDGTVEVNVPAGSFRCERARKTWWGTSESTTWWTPAIPIAVRFDTKDRGMGRTASLVAIDRPGHRSRGQELEWTGPELLFEVQFNFDQMPLSEVLASFRDSGIEVALEQCSPDLKISTHAGMSRLQGVDLIEQALLAIVHDADPAIRCEKRGTSYVLTKAPRRVVAPPVVAQAPVAPAPKPAAPPPPPPSAKNGATYVLVVGIDRYDDAKLAKLDCAESDARAVTAFFAKDPKSPTRGACVVALYGAAATRANVLAKLQKHLSMNAVEPEDTAILYFAGHGLADARNDFYLACRDTALDNLFGTGLAERDLAAAWSRIRAGRKLLLVDACHSGALRNVRGIGGVIAAPSAASGSVTIAATDQGQLSVEDPKAGHGVFTIALLRGLGGEAARDGVVTPDSLGAYLSRTVPSLAARNGGAQSPSVNGAGDFPLTRIAGARIDPSAGEEPVEEGLEPNGK